MCGETPGGILWAPLCPSHRQILQNRRIHGVNRLGWIQRPWSRSVGIAEIVPHHMFDGGEVKSKPPTLFIFDFI